ncbi:hypothetical protein J8J40_34045, partial [Mycobacterium tuberculosis]|nr:hypothetical protein [Mycobacterium tuberculosis]
RQTERAMGSKQTAVRDRSPPEPPPGVWPQPKDEPERRSQSARPSRLPGLPMGSDGLWPFCLVSL